MPRSTLEYLRHILDEVEYLQVHVTGLTKEKLVRDETLKRAMVRSLEVIGEATKQVPDEVRDRHPQVERRAMAGMRDRLIHAYFGVDYDIVRDVVAHKIGPLRAGRSKK